MPPISPTPPASPVSLPPAPIAPPPPASGASPDSLDIQIDDVNRSLWQYIKTHKLRQIILLAPVVIIWEVVVVVIMLAYFQDSSHSSSGGKGLAYILIAPWLAMSAWFYRLRKQFEDAFLQQFATANGYTFAQTGAVDETYGTIFRLPGVQQVSDVVSGTYGGNDLRLFLYELVVEHGRDQRRYANTVIELDLHGSLPNLLMANKHQSMAELDLAQAFSVTNKITLEGDFNQYFELYAPAGNELEALQIFSPDTMAIMEDGSRHYTVEFAANRIYIYCTGLVSTTGELTHLFNLAKQLITKIAPLASRLAHDSAIVATPTNLSLTTIKRPGQQGALIALLTIIAVAFIIAFSVGVALNSGY